MRRSPEPGSGETHRLPSAGVPDKSRCRRPAHLLLERDDAPQRGLESAELLENFGRAPKDCPLDAGEFFMDLSVEFGAAGGFARGGLPRPGRTSSSVRTTATTSTERWRSAKAIQRLRCAAPHEWRAFDVSWPGST